MPVNLTPRRKVANKKPTVTKSPSAKDDFLARTVHHVSRYMLEGSPHTQQAVYGALKCLSAGTFNVPKTLVKAAVTCGNTSIGMPQEVAKHVIHSQKLHDQQANKL
jgi:hypothetical protein